MRSLGQLPSRLQRNALEVRSQFAWLRLQPAFARSPIRTSARLLQWRVRTWTGNPGVVRLNAADATMLVPAQWRGMAKLAYAFGDLAEPELVTIPQFVPPGTIAIDAGAHYGDYVLVLSRAIGDDGEVWAIEPCKDYLDICQANVSFNHILNVRFFEVGLSDKTARATLVSTGDPSMAYVGSEGQQGTPISLMTLDDMVRARGTGGRRIAFLKLDIEGSELAALRGAQETISAHRPLLLVELQKAACQRAGHSVSDLFQAITDHDYVCFVYDWRKSSWLRVEQADTSRPNHLFVPRETKTSDLPRLRMA